MMEAAAIAAPNTGSLSRLIAFPCPPRRLLLVDAASGLRSGETSWVPSLLAVRTVAVHGSHLTGKATTLAPARVGNHSSRQTGEAGMSQQSENQPLSRDQVVHELEFLLTVEHALIVEYLSVRCAMGYDLDPRDGGPATESGRAAAKASKDLADAQMLRVGQL